MMKVDVVDDARIARQLAQLIGIFKSNDRLVYHARGSKHATRGSFIIINNHDNKNNNNNITQQFA